MVMVNGWKQLRKRKTKGLGTSIVYKKDKIFLEIFADSSWNNDNHNVITYDSSVKSYSSAFGTVEGVDYFSTFKEADNFAKSYMGSH